MTISILKTERFYPLGKPIQRPAKEGDKPADVQVRPGVFRKADGTMETRGYNPPAEPPKPAAEPSAAPAAALVPGRVYRATCSRRGDEVRFVRYEAEGWMSSHVTEAEAKAEELIGPFQDWQVVA